MTVIILILIIIIHTTKMIITPTKKSRARTIPRNRENKKKDNGSYTNNPNIIKGIANSP